jgi:HK97 family phage major capsid protein
MDRLGDVTARYEQMSGARAYYSWLVCCGLAGGAVSALDVARRVIGRSPHLALLEKASTSALLTSDAGLDEIRPLMTSAVDLIKRQTIIGRMAGAVRQVPPRVPITIVDTGAVAGFVTEDDPIPVARPALTDTSLTPGKIALITPYSKELWRVSAQRAAALLERDQTRAVAVAEDSALLDGAAAVTGGRPASILFGLSPLGGGSPADIEADALSLLEEVRDGDAVAPFFVTSPAGARYLCTQRDSGTRLFPNVLATGGDIFGVGLIVSAAAPDSLVLVDADSLLVDDEGLESEVTTQASFQFSTTPIDGAANVVSLFQGNAVGVKTARMITWALARANAAAYINLPV